MKPVLGKEVGSLFLYDSFLGHSLKTKCPLDAEKLPCRQKEVCVADVVRMGSAPREGRTSARPMSDTLVGWVGQAPVDSQEKTNKRSIKATDI